VGCYYVLNWIRDTILLCEREGGRASAMITLAAGRVTCKVGGYIWVSCIGRLYDSGMGNNKFGRDNTMQAEGYTKGFLDKIMSTTNVWLFSLHLDKIADHLVAKSA